MARFSIIPIFATPVTKQTITTAAQGAAIELGKHRLFAISGNAAFHLAFGGSGVSASAANFRFPGDAVFTIDMGPEFTHIRIFNPAATTQDFYVQPLQTV